MKYQTKVEKAAGNPPAANPPPKKGRYADKQLRRDRDHPDYETKNVAAKR